LDVWNTPNHAKASYGCDEQMAHIVLNNNNSFLINVFCLSE
jgi:hypothetical protein